MAEVRFLGAIRKAAGTAAFGIDAATVEELLEKLKGVMGPAFQEFVFQGGALQPDVEVVVNGRNIALLGGPKSGLSPFDQVTLSIDGDRAFPGS
jgi:molybdopterin converting factor small subunit